jgi:hypothetical protein
MKRCSLVEHLVGQKDDSALKIYSTKLVSATVVIWTLVISPGVGAGGLEPSTSAV